MLNSENILQELQKHKTIKAKAEKEHDAIIESKHLLAEKRDMKAYSAYIDANMQNLQKLEKIMQKETIITHILTDNYRTALYMEYLPRILDVLKKYAGKKYGEKTKEKIQQEMKDNLHIGFWIDRRYNTFDYLQFYLLNDEGYKTYNMPDFCIGTNGNYPDNVKLNISKDNRINVYPYEDYYLTEARGYIADPAEHAEKILEAQTKVKQAEEAYIKTLSEYKTLLPSATYGKVSGYVDKIHAAY